MRAKIFVVAALVLCMCSLGSAKVPTHSLVPNVHTGDTNRQTGTVGNVSVTLAQSGPLTAEVTVSWDTDPAGAPYYTAYQSYDAFLAYGQIYDTPWIGVCHTSTSSASCNDFISGIVAYTGHDDSNHYSETFSFTVPTADTYQGWGIAYGGWSPGIPWLSGAGQNTGFWITTYNYSTAAGNTAYIDANTPTPDPDAGGQPVPTLNWMGILAMIAMMAGVAMLLVMRRK